MSGGNILITILGLVVVGFFLYGYKHDGVLNELENKKLKDLTVNDIATMAVFIFLIVVFAKLFFDLF